MNSNWVIDENGRKCALPDDHCVLNKIDSSLTTMIFSKLQPWCRIYPTMDTFRDIQVKETLPWKGTGSAQQMRLSLPTDPLKCESRMLTTWKVIVPCHRNLLPDRRKTTNLLDLHLRAIKGEWGSRYGSRQGCRAIVSTSDPNLNQVFEGKGYRSKFQSPSAWKLTLDTVRMLGPSIHFF